MSLRELIIQRIRASGPLTFAEYMDLALYHPELGYYARADRRSGRAGDFFTSVDVGPLFGQLLARQFADMWRRLGPDGTRPAAGFDLVEVGASNGRLARDVLEAAADIDPAFYAAIRLHLVERSRAAREAQPGTLGPHAAKLVTSNPDALPDEIAGVVFANELLDALPTHRVVMTEDGLREVYVDVNAETLVDREGPPSTLELVAYVDRLGEVMAVGCRAEINLRALDWVRTASERLRRGFLLLIDYGHDARALYTSGRGHGSLMAYRRHTSAGPPSARLRDSDAGWLTEPGEWDLTSHVDLTSVGRIAEEHGLQPLGMLDQTYFLLGLGAAESVTTHEDTGITALKRRLSAKTLLLPGGLGSTHKVIVFGKDVGTPTLAGCAYHARLT